MGLDWAPVSRSRMGLHFRGRQRGRWLLFDIAKSRHATWAVFDDQKPIQAAAIPQLQDVRSKIGYRRQDVNVGRSWQSSRCRRVRFFAAWEKFERAADFASWRGKCLIRRPDKHGPFPYWGSSINQRKHGELMKMQSERRIACPDLDLMMWGRPESPTP
ncbi:hypothetical protein N658DRAFT_252165 [Parathielavia hyrcaniae]|uniref:Uncharacterized protein n=1 Tax=Parathielavia hyrcaniae TaxID=113614 RepID=A0AAN6SYV2_9PEZI|nr:hypothetical protein N658DRAFT_252165 [Parathielavia hyrcaniae]